jgi:hypothetical protein
MSDKPKTSKKFNVNRQNNTKPEPEISTRYSKTGKYATPLGSYDFDK